MSESGQNRKSDVGLRMSESGQLRKSAEAAETSAFGGRDAMRLKDAASCSFDCFNKDLKERPDGTVSSG